MKTIPLYVYFPKSEWANIRKAEEDSDEGKSILEYYSKIYKENFLKNNQSDKKVMFNEASDKQPTRAKNPDKITKDNSSSRDGQFTNKKMTETELALLTMNN